MLHKMYKRSENGLFFHFSIHIFGNTCEFVSFFFSFFVLLFFFLDEFHTCRINVFFLVQWGRRKRAQLFHLKTHKLDPFPSNLKIMEFCQKKKKNHKISTLNIRLTYPWKTSIFPQKYRWTEKSAPQYMTGEIIWIPLRSKWNSSHNDFSETGTYSLDQSKIGLTHDKCSKHRISMKFKHKK